MNVHLQTGQGVQVTYDGHVYNGGDTIPLDLNMYDTVQLQSFNDLTGTHITYVQSTTDTHTY